MLKRCLGSQVLVYGSLNIDYVYAVEHFVQPGETFAASSRNVFAGGKGLNQAVALSKAGAEVSFAGAVGRNDGTILLRALLDNNIAACLVRERKDLPSGHTVIQVDSHGQNCILLFGGANQSQTREEIEKTLDNYSRGSYVVLQNEINELGFLIEEASRRDLKVCLNVSPLNDTIKTLPLERCAYLIVNELEGSRLVNLSADTDPNKILEALESQYPQANIVLTLGTRGSMVSILNDQGKREHIRAKSFKVDAIDTTAAGDTFLGYFIANMAAGKTAQDALSQATAASAIAVTRKGATPSIPTPDEVAAFLEEHGSPIVDKLS